VTPPKKDEKPLRRDAEENRRRLLAAAREVFAERGLEPTMDEVAARAGVGVGTAYRRFANKEELITALFRERIGEMGEVTEAALVVSERDPWQGIVSYLEGATALGAGDKGFRQLLLSSPQSREFVDEARALLEPRVEELVARAHRAKCLRPGIEPSDIFLVLLMISEVSDYRPESETPPWRRFLPLLVDGLKAEAGGPLPGAPLGNEELEDVFRG